MRRQLAGPTAAMILGISLIPLTGCVTVKPKYTTPVSPQMAKAAEWSSPLAGGAAAKQADDQTLSSWWTTLGDPILTSLEERAVKGNLDLRKAEAKIRQARAQRNSIHGNLLPTVTATGTSTGSRSSGRSGIGGVGQSHSVTVDASWEPDFYGKLSTTVDAYQADLESTQEDLRNTLVSLTAEVALDYVNVRSYQSQIAIAQSNLKSQQATYNLVVDKSQSGLATELDVAQAGMNVESTRATIPTLESSLQTSIHAIAVLLGERPGAIDAELAAEKPVPVIPVEVAVGLPADLLRRRPDIRSAERQVAAQTMRVGVAKGDLYPSFTLSGALGLSSLTIQNLFTPAALAGNLAGSVTHTIFNRGQIREKIKIQDALLDQYVTAYESTVLTALQDVEDALVAFAQEQVRRKSLATATVSAERAATLSSDLYNSGLKTFLDVLDAQRSLLTLQNELAQSDASITADLVRLYKAMGGGWNPNAGASAPSGQAASGTN